MSRLLNLSLGSRDGFGPHSLFAGFCLFVMVSVIPASATVVINELMYSSYEPWATTNDTEYVELFNIGTQTVDLVNYRLDQGVDFDFEAGTLLAPGQFIVVCEDLFVFTNYYTDVTNAVGNYAGGLSGGGERVTLSRFDGESWVEEDSIAYVDFGPSDGDGPSLELVNPGYHVMRSQHAGAWYASTPIVSSRGTPGTTNSVYVPVVAPVVGAVIHDPPLPPAFSAIRVTCKGFSATKGVQPELSVWYRKDDLDYAANENPNEWQITPMSDNGFSGDAVAGDKIFTSYIPTNGSLMTMEANDILEFKIHATDASGVERLYPIEAWSGAKLQSLSYLCKFGTDAGFTGEYMTYHILMTKSNQDSTALFDVPPENEINQDGWTPYNVQDWEEQGLYKHPPYLDFLHDCTVVTSDGKIFYNCGVRKRGDSRNSSRNDDYRVSLPENVVHNGSDRLTFMFNEVFDNVFGNHVADNVGYGAVAIDSGLARLWVNDHFVNAGFGCVAQMGALSRSFFKDRFGDDDPGNFYYVNKKPFKATLAYNPSISSYIVGSAGYGLKGVNTNTAYYEVQELTRRFAMPYQTAHTNLPPMVDIRSVARTCAAMVALNNIEGGYCAPKSQGADEGRFYMRGSDGKFVLIPWDLDSIIGANAYVWWWPSANGVGNAYRNILYTKPGIPYYAGDCVEMMTNYLSDENLQVLFEEMGSLMPSSTRISWRNTFTSQRNAILGKVYTGFTLSVGGTSVDENTLAVIANSSSVNIDGRASQMYVQEVEVNGAKAEWDAWAPNGSSASSSWSYYTTNSFALTSTVTHVVVREMGGKKWKEYNQLRMREFYVINNSGSISRSGTISANTTWTGVNTITGDVTVNSGATLTIDPGATLLFDAGTRIHVTDGMLEVKGSKASPVNMLPNDETAWSLEATGGSASISNGYARMVAGHVVGNAAASVTMYRCHQTDFSLNSFTSTPLLMQECLISEFSDCGIELVNAPAASVVWKTTVSDSVGSGDVEGIRISGSSSGNVTNCLIRGISGSAIDSTTTSSGLMVCDSLIYNCGTGIVATGTAIMNHDNTIDSCAVGLLGSAQTVSDGIIMSNSTSISFGPATVAFSDVQSAGTTLYPGANNLNQNPWFSQVTTNDYRLLVQSSCIGNASDGGDMGARFPAGANPATPVVINGTNVGASQINITWADNSGSEEYTFEVQRSNDDNGPWVTVGHAAADATNFVDSGLSEDDSFFYRLRAMHNRGQSYWTTVYAARTGFETTTQLLKDGLRLTEIMFNPPNSASDVHEFLEIKNISGSSLDLSDMFFDSGIDFTFPGSTTLNAGEFFVLVAHGPSFEARYPTTNYHGVFENGSGLNNGGERIRLRDADTNTIIYVTYDDGSDPLWYATTDGGGYSLVIADVAGDPEMPGSWRASSFENGSPGMDDPASPHDGIVINEILSHTDTPLGDGIELHNTSASGIDVGEWYLSDNVDDLKKYQIPGPRVIAAGGYYTFYETNSFGPYFALHEHGEEVYLSSASSTNLTSFRTWVTFGATDNGVSLGRYTRSDGEVDLTAMASYTDAASNSAPLVGPVVISEIMYNPIDGSREFVELQNIAATNIPLFDTVFPSNSWKMTGAFDYTFPTNIWMAPGEIFLIVDAEEAIFRAAYGYTNQDVRIFGPFSGDLDNNGETVRLMKAGRQDLDGLPYIVGDAVRYNDVAPWPWAADNDGPSLERKVLADYGNDPTNWVAGSMGGTPGAANNVAGLPTVGFEDATGKTLETNTTAYATILLSPPFNESVTVDYEVTGTASNGVDYNLTSGSVVFWPYDTKVSIPIEVLDDFQSDEYDETVRIQLTSVTPNALRGGNRIYTLTIVDTDPTVVESPTISADGIDVTGTHDYSFEPPTTITMTSTVTNAVIYYNLYGNPPTTSDNIYTGAFELACSARIMARAFFGGHHQSDVAEATLLAQAPPLVLPSPLATFAQIQNSEDDCDQTFIGRDPVGLTEPSVRMTEGVFKWSGFRFADVGIPSNAVITNAYIQFASFGVGSCPKPVYIFGEAADDALSFANAPVGQRPSGRNLTTNSVMWNPSPWPMPSSRGLEQRTPDLSAIINEVISRPGWATSNAIAFVITNANLGEAGVDLAVTAFDSSPSLAAELVAVRWMEKRTNFSLGVQTNGGGIIITGGNKWFDVGATATISYVAAAHYEFAGWSGAVPVADKYNNPLDLIMNKDRTVVGVFAPCVTSNSTPFWWLAQYYPTQTNDLEALAVSDTDSDGMTAVEEYLCDTDPNNPTSVLEVVHGAANGGGVDVTWPASPDRIYSLYCTTNLSMYAGPVDISWAASPIASSIFGNMSGTNTYTHSDPPTNFFFYRIGVAIP